MGRREEYDLSSFKGAQEALAYKRLGCLSGSRVEFVFQDKTEPLALHQYCGCVCGAMGRFVTAINEHMEEIRGQTDAA